MTVPHVTPSLPEEAAAHPSLLHPAHVPGQNPVYGFCRGLCRIVSTQMFDLRTYGRRHVPRTGGVLLVSNHQSYLDPVLLGVQLSRPIGFLAKSELFENKYFGGLIKRLNAFPVRRGEGDIGAVREVLRRLKEGHVVTIFPEGTRSRDGQLRPVQAGVAMLVRRAGVPVIPAVIDGSFHAWPPGQKFPKPHPARVMYRPALNIEGLKGDKIVDLISRSFREMMAELRAKPLDAPEDEADRGL